MTSGTLADIWSLQQNLDRNPSPPSVDDVLLNDLLTNRWGAHHLAVLFAIIPSSETRLRNEGLVPLYACIRAMVNQMADILRAQGTAVPQYPDIPEDWREEAEIDYETLKAALFPYLAKPVRDSIEYTITTTEMNDKYHWTSLVAPASVMLDVYLESMAATKRSGGTTVQGSTPTTYPEAVIGDKALEPYTEAMMGNDLAQIVGVVREELLRIRSAAGETGWREDEAKELSEGNLNRMTEFFIV